MYLQTSHFIHKKEIEKEKKKKGNLIQIQSLIPCIGIVELEEYKHIKTSTYTNGPYHLLNQKKKKKKKKNTNRMRDSITLQTLYIYKWVSPLS